MAPRPPSATRISLALLGAAHGRSLAAPALIGGGEILGASPNAMRVALSRLAANGDARVEGRARYALSGTRLGAFAHVGTYRTGFAARVPWQGVFVGALTSGLSRRNATLVRRRARALDLVGMREYRHGLFLRPDNLEGGRAVVAAHLGRLGLDEDAEILGVSLDPAQVRGVEALYAVKADGERAVKLEEKVVTLLAGLSARPKRKVAIESFWLGDEVLRFLARDPLLPESMSDPAPRRALATAMAVLDDEARAIWTSYLEEFEGSEGRAG